MMDERIYRKTTDTLIITGNGVIAFGLWSVIRAVLFIIIYHGPLADILRESINTSGGDPTMDPALFEKAVFVLLFVLFLVVVLVILALHFYVGLSARAVGFGTGNRRFYLFLAVFMILCILCFMVIYAANIAAYLGWNPPIEAMRAMKDGGKSLAMTEISKEQNPVIDTIVNAVVDLTVLITLVRLVISSVQVKRYRKERGGQE